VGQNLQSPLTSDASAVLVLVVVPKPFGAMFLLSFSNTRFEGRRPRGKDICAQSAE